jgi:cytochrome P450
VLATESSVPTWRRVAAHDTNLGGDLIPAGTEILLELSGNRITANPSTANPVTADHGPENPLPPDAGRGHSAGLVFGSGIHRCLGAKLAELEATVIVREAAAALPEIRLHDPDPAWIRLLSFQAPRTVTAATGQG